jgi:hypothetical protein
MSCPGCCAALPACISVCAYGSAPHTLLAVDTAKGVYSFCQPACSAQACAMPSRFSCCAYNRQPMLLFQVCLHLVSYSHSCPLYSASWLCQHPIYHGCMHSVTCFVLCCCCMCHVLKSVPSARRQLQALGMSRSAGQQHNGAQRDRPPLREPSVPGSAAACQAMGVS